MSARWARMAFTAYRVAGSLAYPAVGPYVGWRTVRGKEERDRRRERYGYPSEIRPEGRPLVWLHAASVGESAAIMPLAQDIAAEGIRVLMTTGTVTSATLVRERLGNTVIHQYVPLDLKPCVSRFLDHWRPDLAITAESEIWPMTVSELGKRRVPQVLVNARMSDGSFKRWKGAPALAEALLENFTQIVAQSDIDGERYHLLGARTVSVAGNLKADVAPPSVDPKALDQLRRALGPRPVWAAVSTHDGEEKLVAAAHLKIREESSRVLTVIVPRHIDRADAVERHLKSLGLNVARWSRQEVPDPTTDILLGDTIGDMGLYLRLTEVAFIGKSVASEGGQNPLEAAMLGTAILSGRYVQNFREIYQNLLRNGGAKILSEPVDLAGEVLALLRDPVQRRTMIEGARTSVGEMQGAFRRTMAALDPLLLPLRLSLQMDRR